MLEKVKDLFQSLTIISYIKAFFVGLILQFMLHTFITYIIHMPDTGIYGIIWMRKELFIIVLGIRSVYQIYTKDSRKDYILRNKRLSIITLVTIISILISLTTSILIHQQSVVTFALSAKFNYFPLIILIVGGLVSTLTTDQERDSIMDYIITIIKYVMIFGVLWYGLLHTFPNVLDRIGYSQPGESIEWTANTPPPSLWLTNFYDGFIRNQGPFSGPLSFGFYMVCLFPLFYTKVLYKQKISHVWYRWVLYTFSIISTFSRASWIMRFIQLLFIAAIVYRRYIVPIFIGSIITLGGLVGYTIITNQTDIFIRKRSDQGHEKFLDEGIQYLKDNRLWGKGAASVGPASYHKDDGSIAFNTENQYMQVWIEYGLIGFLSWVVIYIIIALLSARRWRSLRRGKSIIDIDHLARAGPFVILIALSIGGMVLHPLTDSSSMYPCMMIVGLSLGSWCQTIMRSSQVKFSHEKDRKNHRKRFSLAQYATVVILFFFVIQTQIVNGWGLLSSSIMMSSMRDGITLVIGVFTLFLYNKYILSFIGKYKSFLVVLTLLSLWSLISGYIFDTSILHFLAGLKFDLSYLVLLLLGLWWGHCIAQSERGHHLVVSFFQWLWKLLPWIIILGILWQGCKIIWPDLFIQYGGYGIPGDFAPRSHPPMYYITGPGGIPRLSGLFVGPNTLGFFLILFGNSRLYRLWENKIKRNYLIVAFLGYIACIIATLSRSAILAITIQALIISIIPIIEGGRIARGKFRNYISKRVMWLIIILSLSGSIIIIMNKWKDTSNGERMSSFQESYSLLIQNPISGYGPGYVGPARHYHPDYIIHPKNTLALIENIYVQIRINLGLPGILLRLSLWIYIFHHIRNIIKQEESGNKKILTKYLLTFSISVISLLCVGWFLDIFIDSMVNYLFFIPWGILIGSLYIGNIRHME